MKTYYIYMITSQNNNALYIGMTTNLEHRMIEHITGTFPSAHTAKYKIKKLVYFEEFSSFEDAALRENRLKKWKREWKNNLIVTMNPGWEDLAPGLIDYYQAPASAGAPLEK